MGSAVLIIRRTPESIEWFVEGQPFWRSDDSAPRPLPPPPTPTPVIKLDRRRTGRLKKRGEGDGVGEEPNHTTLYKKTFSLINHSILSGRIFFLSLQLSWVPQRCMGRESNQACSLRQAGLLCLLATPHPVLQWICTVPSARSLGVGWAILAVVDRFDQELNPGQLGDQRRQVLNIASLMGHCKKELAVFPSPAGMSLIKLCLGGNNLVFFRPERVWSVTSRLGTGK